MKEREAEEEGRDWVKDDRTRGDIEGLFIRVIFVSKKKGKNSVRVRVFV